MGRELDAFEELPELLEHLDNLALLTDVAFGDYEDAKDVYLKYGLTAEQWRFLNKTTAFKAAVARVRSELEKSGKMTQAKARLMADDLMEVVYREAMDPESGAPLEKRLEVLKVFAKLADLEPNKAVVAKGASGPAFAIQINIAQPTSSAYSSSLISAQAIDIKPEEGE